MNERRMSHFIEYIDAILALDASYFMRESPLTDPLVVLAGMHKARYELQAATAQMKVESRAWLEANGFTRLKGLPFDEQGA